MELKVKELLTIEYSLRTTIIRLKEINMDSQVYYETYEVVLEEMNNRNLLDRIKGKRI